MKRSLTPMRELQNPFICKMMKKSPLKIGASFSLPLLLICTLGGCVTKIRDSVQDLPDTIALASHNATDQGFPDLRKIPPIPTDMKSDKDWSLHKDKLEVRRLEIESAPNSRLATKEESDITWAQSAKTILEKDPRAQPAKPDEEALAWAARMRALLNIPNEPALNE